MAFVPITTTSGDADGGRSVRYRADRRLDGNGLLAVQQVQLDDQIASGVEAPRHAVRRDNRSAAWRPADEMSFRVLHVQRGHAVESRLAIFAVMPPSTHLSDRRG